MNLNALITLATQLGGLLALVFYASIVLWTYKDAKRRLDDPILIATSVACSMLPVVGVFVYMLLRPPEYLADVRERELEIRAMERTLGRAERCPYCKSHIEGDYLSCPVCTTKLRQACRGCEKPLDPRWQLCPFCETEVPNRGPRDTPPGGGRPRREQPTSTSRSEAARRSATRSREQQPPRRDTETPARPDRDTTIDPLRTEPFQRFGRQNDAPQGRAPIATGPSSPTSRPDGL